MRKAVKLFIASLVLLLSGVLAFAQNITVKGVVTDAATGEPVPGAMVIVKGTTRGASTSDDGSYSINVPANGTLVFSLVGYLDQEVAVNGQAQINAAIEVDSQLLEETIIIGYGTSTKSSFTGSASMVKADAIEKKVTTNVTTALAGTTPGVQVFTASGDPAAGGSNTIRIRGYGSMQASQDPLIILDGSPYDGSMSDINPQDVESLSVLKDASAAAIYGNRGANGVILITTKKGKAGEAKVKFDARFGANTRLIPNYDVITDPGQYYEMWFTKMYNNYYYSGHSEAESYAFANENLYDQNNGGLGYQVYTVPEGENLIGYNFKLNPNAKLGYSDGEYYYIPDDWYKETFRTGYRQEYNLSASGASGRFNYYASAGYLHDGGIINNSDYERYTGRINAEYQAKDWIKLITTMGFSHSNSESVSGGDGDWGSSGNLFYLVNTIAPIYPLYVRKLDAGGNPYIVKENGKILYDSNNTNQVRASTTGNAIRDNEYDSACNIADVLTGKFGFVLTPIKGLSVSGNISLTDDNTRYNGLSSKFGSAASVDGAASVSHSRFFSVNKQFLAEYKTCLLGVHNIDVLAGYEGYNYTTQGLSGYNYHLFNPNVGELNNADDTPTSSAQLRSSTNKYATEGFLSRAQYDYDGKYFLNASFRRDASSRFAEGHRWGNFWSAGAAWLVSQESFLKDVSWVNMLKAKISYGESGNDDVGSLYPYADQYSHSYNPDTKIYSLSLTYKGNPDLTWETKQSLNFGFDFELLNGYLNGTLDFYSQKTKDLLYSKNVPLSSGNPAGFMYVNVGSLQNNGIELALDGNILNTNKVLWRWNANFSHNKNKILKLDPSVSEEGIKGSFRIMKEGGSLYQGYMYKYAGVNKETGEALYWHHVTAEDHNKEKPEFTEYAEGTDVMVSNFSKASQYDIGDFLPKLSGGLGTTVSAFGFDFSVQCSYQLGGRYYDGSYQALMQTQSNAGYGLHKDLLKAWTPDNRDTDVPRWDGDIQVAQSAVDRFAVSSNYLSLDNITLGYTVPVKLVNKIKLSQVRFYVSGENLAVLSARQGVDPRFTVGLGGYASGGSLNQSYYSARRTVTGGVTVTF